MDHRVPSSAPNPEPKFCTFPASMLCEHCHKIVSQHDADSTSDVLNGRNLFKNLKQLDTLFAHLTLQRSDLKRNINRHYCPIIQKLPQDVLAVVFSFCLPNYLNFYTSLSKFDLSAPLILGAVCKDWREVAWSSPRLWSAMAINISSSKTIFESQTSLAREWLARSGQLPLSIRIAWEWHDSNFHLDPAQFSTVINNESSRWHTFHLSVPPDIYHMFCRPNFSAPLLESLRFHSNEFQRDGDFTFRLRHCPRLREIRITNVSIRWIKVPTDTITRIYADGLSMFECRKIIRRIPSLVYCELRDIILDASHMHPLSTNLKHLAIQVDSEYTVTKIFRDITAPRLETLRFEMICTSLSGIKVVDTLRSFLVRSGCSLHTFTLVDALLSLDSMMNLLEAMPMLKNLTVRGETEVILKVLARVIASQGKPTRQGFLANLETLTFIGYPNFRPRKVPHMNAIGPWTPHYTPERPLCSVTLEFYGPVEHLPEEAIPFFLALKEYGVTLKVCVTRGIEDLLQATIDFYKSIPQSLDWIQDMDLNLIGLEA